MKRLIATLALLALPIHVLAAERTERFYGYAYDLNTGRYLYTEVHQQRASGEKWTGGSIRYFLPDGKEFGIKTLDFSANPIIPLYRLELSARGGYSEGISAVGEKIELFRQDYGEAAPRKALVDQRLPMTADSGFHSFLRAHFEELLEGKVLEFRFAVAGYLDVFKFRAKRVEDSSFEGKPAVRLRVEPDSLLSLLGKPLEISYEPGERRLVEYRGISNIHDPATGEPFDVRIAYYKKKPADAPATLPPLE